MNHNLLNPGKDAPKRCNAIIEISSNSGPIKYEFDHEVGIMVVDRFMPTSMSYPCNYGFIPGTLSGDGDPVDVLVHSSAPILSGAMIKVKPIGVLITEDESGHDEKILAVPDDKVDPFFKNINALEDVQELMLHKIQHFFENYKKLEPGKWVKVTEWQGAEKAYSLIAAAIERYANSSVK
jgi:inorganic pyrophosphatase